MKLTLQLSVSKGNAIEIFKTLGFSKFAQQGFLKVCNTNCSGTSVFVIVW